MNYDKASNLDINKAVAVALGFELVPEQDGYQTFGDFSEDSIRVWHEGEVEYDDGEKAVVRMAVGRDYCDKAYDAWPIILENKISITWTGSYWVSAAPLSHSLSTCETNDKPLRAAMVVFLKMQKQSDDEQSNR